MLRALVALALLASVGVGQAETLTVTLRQTAEPIRHVYPGRTLAVDGIELGMTVEEVRRKLAVLGARVTDDVELSPLMVHDRGMTAVARPYLSALVGFRSIGSGWVSTSVRFGLPSTGSRVVAVEKSAKFDTAGPLPTVKSVLGQLVDAYGPESTTNRLTSDAAFTAAWIYSETGQQKCADYRCGQSSFSLDADDLSERRELLKTGRHVGLVALLSPPERQPFADQQTGPVASITVQIHDIANEVLTIEQGVGQLHAAVTTALSVRLLKEAH